MCQYGTWDEENVSWTERALVACGTAEVRKLDAVRIVDVKDS